ncbi:RdgB/HAM1 family non-canonical purine NTP pyrophosphatase [Thermocrinis sp.]
MDILLATQNRGKIRELTRMLKPLGISVVEPEEDIKVEEYGNSFMENAYLKAMAYYKKYCIPTLADDSGLVIPSLDGYPGVFSSRFYALDWGGKEPVKTTKDQANISKVLRLLEGRSDRRAHFKAVVCLMIEEDLYLFAEGTCQGEIVETPRGSEGFGYDPIFKPLGQERTMAELSPEEKDLISHRGKALRKLLEFLKECKSFISYPRASMS